MMFDRFTERAQKVLAISARRSDSLGDIIILEQSIFYLGLVREGEGIAAKALEAIGIKSRQMIRKEV